MDAFWLECPGNASRKRGPYTKKWCNGERVIEGVRKSQRNSNGILRMDCTEGARMSLRDRNT